MATTMEAAAPARRADRAADTSLAIIIPTKGRPHELLETVRSIARQTRRPDVLIIVDQSPVSAEEAVRAATGGAPGMALRYLWDPTLSGLVSARKCGMAWSESDIVFFVDDDVTLASDCIENLLARYAAEPDLAGICAVDMQGLSVPWWLVLVRRAYMLGPFSDRRSIINKRYRRLSAPELARLFSGGYMSFRRSVFSEFQFEDRAWGSRWSSSIDFSYRVSARYPTVIDPSVRVLHRNPNEQYDPAQWVRIRVDGVFFFFQRNLPRTPRNMLCFLWLLFAIFVSSTMRGLRTGQLARTVCVFLCELPVGFRMLRQPLAEPSAPEAAGRARSGAGTPWPRRPVTIAIIIPTKNRQAELLEALQSVRTQVRRPEELIIVDQSQVSGEAEVRALLAGCTDMTLRYLWDPAIAGLVNARIRGVNATASDVVFFVDDDITLQSDCTAKLAQRYDAHPEYAGICAVDVGGQELPWWLILARRLYMLGPFRDERSLMNKRCSRLSAPRGVRLFSGGWMSYRRWVFREFQFEASLWGHRWNGSTDFSYRVSAWYPLVIDPAVRIRHRLPYGKHSPEDFVRIRVSGTFFFFYRNVRKNALGWTYFALVLWAIFVRSLWRGLETRALRQTLRTFVEELRKGARFIRRPFPASY